MKADATERWIRKWSKKWRGWQTRRLPPPAKHLAIIQELISVHPEGLWYRAVVLPDANYSQDEDPGQTWTDYLCSAMSWPCFVKPRLNAKGSLSNGLQIIFTNTSDLTTFTLVYPEAAPSIRKFEPAEFEQFLRDTLNNWGYPPHIT